MRGRKPVPAAVQEANGNPGKRAKRGIGVALPAGRVQAPRHFLADDLPDDLDAARRAEAIDFGRMAREMWDRCIAAMEAYPKLFTQMDEVALELVAGHYALWRMALRRVRHEGIHSPLAIEARQQGVLLHRLLSDFGFTPAARVRLCLRDEDEADELDLLLAGEDVA